MQPNAPTAVRKMLRYSGNTIAVKKRHTVKNTVMSRLDKFIVFLGGTFTGHHHDYTMLKAELPPELTWFTDINMLFHRFRNHKDNFEDDVIGICAGLWNFALSY